MQGFSKKVSLIFIAFMFAIGGLFSSPNVASSQVQIVSVTLESGQQLLINCPTSLTRLIKVGSQTWSINCRNLVATPTASPTSIASATATQTQVSLPTTTPTVSNTNTPQAPTATSSGTLIQPYANAPLCSQHDPTQWHGLWNYQLGCHYDHTHGDDPSLADSYFGKLGAFWDGSTISYPFNSGSVEVTTKHAGYKISVRTPNYHPWSPCGVNDNNDVTGDHSDNCIIASRIEYHVVGSLMDLAHRYHSYWLEAYICKPPYRQPQDCGIVRTGGLLDYGQLQAPHYNDRILRNGGTLDFGNGIVITYMADGADLPATSGEPYVFSIPYTDIQDYQNPPPHATLMQSANATIDQWSSNDFDCEPHPVGDPCHNMYTHVLFQVGDSFNLVDYNVVNGQKVLSDTVRWICYGQANCEYNGSEIGMNEIAVRVMQAWQSNGNGFVTFNGYSDKWGNPKFDNSCTSVSADCVPFVIEHAPVGMAASRSDNGCECQVWEYDIYFNGKPSNWIKFPN